MIIHTRDTVEIDDYLDIEKMTSNAKIHPKYQDWAAMERVLAQQPDNN